MLKKNKGLMILTSVIILLTVLAGILLWDRLPEQMATHWGGNGEADGWSSRPVAVFGLPLFLLAIHWLGVWMTGQDRRNRNQNEKVLQMMFWIAPVISLFGMGSTYASALGQPPRIDRLAMLLLGSSLRSLETICPNAAKIIPLASKSSGRFQTRKTGMQPTGWQENCG